MRLHGFALKINLESVDFFLSAGSTNLDSIQIIKKVGGSLKDSYLESGYILDKKIGVGQPRRMENAKILVANTSMDTDKIKIYGNEYYVYLFDEFF